MAITTLSPDGARWYLYLAPPVAQPYDTFNYYPDRSRAMMMLASPYCWNPPVSLSTPLVSSDLSADDRQHVGFGYRESGSQLTKSRAAVMMAAPYHFDPPVNSTFVPAMETNEVIRQHLGYGFTNLPDSGGDNPPAAPDPNTRVLTSSKHPPLTEQVGEFYDAPCVFSPDRSTAWEIIVSNTGVFSARSTSMACALFEYIPMFNSYTQTDEMIRVSNAGAFLQAVLGAEQILIPTVLSRGGIVYLPDGRFPPPIGTGASSWP